MPDKHAMLGPSSAHRWLVCTAAPHFEEQFPKTTSVYASKGTLAHQICELYVLEVFYPDQYPSEKVQRVLDRLKTSDLYEPRMLETAAFYRDYIIATANSFPETPHVVPEVKVSLEPYVPEGFGTCDCVLIGGDRLHIIDYKNGKGVVVSSNDNPQMKLYALGALLKYGLLYNIETITVAIVQPNVTEDVEEFTLTKKELMDWAITVVKPKAREAFDGPGTFCPGEHCMFCAGKSQCRARADRYMSAYDEFRYLIPSESTDDNDALREAALDGQPVLSDDEIGAILEKVADMQKWVDDMQSYITGRLLGGNSVSGWKLVEGRTKRRLTDPAKAVKTLKLAFGSKDEDLYKPAELKSMGDLEKMFGKTALHAVLDSFLEKPQGKPTLVPASEKRPEYNPAAADFAAVEKSKE